MRYIQVGEIYCVKVFPTNYQAICNDYFSINLNARAKTGRSPPPPFWPSFCTNTVGRWLSVRPPFTWPLRKGPPALGPTPRGQPGVLRVHWDNPGSISHLVPQPQLVAKSGQWVQEPFVCRPADLQKPLFDQWLPQWPATEHKGLCGRVVLTQDSS